MERLTSRNALERWTSESETPELEEFVMIRGRALGRTYFESDRDYKDYCDALDELAAYEDLEEQGRLIVLPCKVWDTVYVVVRGKIRKAKVDSVYYDGKSIGIVYSYNHFGACVGSGKTVFLSRAEAEKAMEVTDDA